MSIVKLIIDTSCFQSISIIILFKVIYKVILDTYSFDRLRDEKWKRKLN